MRGASWLPLAAAAVVVAGCGHLAQLSEFPAIQLRVDRFDNVIAVHSSTWPTPETSFLICWAPLPSLEANLDEYTTIEALEPSCVGLGRHRLGPRNDALLVIKDLSERDRVGLDTAPDWYLVLLGITGDNVFRHVSRIDGGPIERP
jgi:hypothetical protein